MAVALFRRHYHGVIVTKKIEIDLKLFLEAIIVEYILENIFNNSF
jgi:hypothetical protein